MTERALDLGTVGSLAWVLTDRRLVIAHRSTIPGVMPRRERLLELRAWGWSNVRIAEVYGVDPLRVAREMR